MLHFLYGFMARDSGGKDVFVQFPRLTDRASALSTRDNPSLSILSRAERDSKPRGCAWFKLGQPHRCKKARLRSKRKNAALMPLKSPPSHVAATRYGNHPASCRTGFPACRQTRSTSTCNGCSSILAINKTSHCFCSATSKV